MEERKWNKLKGNVFGCKSSEGFTDYISDEDREKLKANSEEIVITNVETGQYKGVSVIIYYDSTDTFYLFMIKDTRINAMEGGTLLKMVRQSHPLTKEQEDQILAAISASTSAARRPPNRPPAPPAKS